MNKHDKSVLPFRRHIYTNIFTLIKKEKIDRKKNLKAVIYSGRFSQNQKNKLRKLMQINFSYFFYCIVKN